MYRSKKDVDKHVESLLSKLPAKEFKTRAYSIARLYFDVGDYTSCQKYVEQYLTQKDNNAAAYKLLGQALFKLGQKEKALEHYKNALSIDATQTTLILDICELLADDEILVDTCQAKYWCEKAEATFPKHPITFRLRERLVAITSPNPEAVVNLLLSELEARPKDAVLHVRLLRHYLGSNKVKEAFEHSTNIEFSAPNHNFRNHYGWYETLLDVLKHCNVDVTNWLYQQFLLAVREHICVLSLSDIGSGTSKSLVESNELLHLYDQAIDTVARAGPPQGFGEFHSSLLQHHRGQFAFHAATFLLKKAKKDQLKWKEATKFAAPLMLIAWHTVPLDCKVNWLMQAPEKLKTAVKQWYVEGAYRCSQAGHYLVANSIDKGEVILDQISQYCSGAYWRDKIYEKLFTSRDHLAKMKSSHFVTNSTASPTLRLPRKSEVQAYDDDAQTYYAYSLHHFVWILLNYKNIADFKCTLFDMLIPKSQNYANCGPESLSKLDINAFLYCAVITSRQQLISKQLSYLSADKPKSLPANITELLCTLPQMKWWDCTYKYSQNELGSDLTDIRLTLSRGIEVVRCVDNHGLDPELLCSLGRIFSHKAKLTSSVDEKNQLETRASLYYSSATPLLEKLKNKIVIKIPEKRMFDYTHKELTTKDINSLIEESKIFVALSHLSDGEYERVINMLSNLKSPQAYYHLSETYRKMAQEENNLSKDSSEWKMKNASLLSKAKTFAYKALDKLKETEVNKNHPLYGGTQELIEDIELQINKIDPDMSLTIINDEESKYSSDDNVSPDTNNYISLRTNSRAFRNLSSTPKQQPNANMTNYRTAVDSQILESSTRIDQRHFDRIENQIMNLQKRDGTINEFMDQTRVWFDENRKLGNQIISTINMNIQQTTDQFKLLKLSVDQVKDQIDECRNECKDVGELKKQIADLKKEVNKLKKTSSEQNITENDLYNMEDEYRTNESGSSFTAQLPFAPSQVIPPFNPRLVPPFPVPPNPYQLYTQNLYNLYSQYSQFGQPPTVPGASQIFDTARSQVNYPGVYPTPDQMYLDVAHLIPPVPTATSVASVPTVPVPTVPAVPVVPVPSVPKPTIEVKDIPKSLPVNVVITSSDPLPTCTTVPAPVLSVTIPNKHIKGSPHNYQIPMPSANDSKVIAPPVFSFPTGNKISATTTVSSLSNWNVMNTTQASTPEIVASSVGPFAFTPKTEQSLDNSKSVVDGIFSGASPNTSLNKSRTLSERSNTSVENYDPCPDFKPIIPLPAEVKVTTGEEDEAVIFSARAKLFRFVDKQWKERGLGEMKLLKHKITGKIRVLMRREQIHKICANHFITPDLEINQMKNETKSYIWAAPDYADETMTYEKFCIRFKTEEIALQFYEAFEKARKESTSLNTSSSQVLDKAKETPKITQAAPVVPVVMAPDTTIKTESGKTVVGGFTFSTQPTFQPVVEKTDASKPTEPATTKANVFGNLTFKTSNSSPFSNLFPSSIATATNMSKGTDEPSKLNTSDTVEEFEPTAEFKPVVPLPAIVETKTGEEDEIILFEHRAKLLRYIATTKEWKERGLGNIKLLVHKDNIHKLRLLMRREQVMKVCCNHSVTPEMTFQKMPNVDKAVTWCAKDFSEGELIPETFCLRFKTSQACDDFINAVKLAQSKMKDGSKAAKEEKNAAKQNNQTGFGDKFKPKTGSWQCEACYTNNLENFSKCACCEASKPQDKSSTDVTSTTTGSTVSWGDKFKPKAGSWECSQCLIRNEASVDHCVACNVAKDPSKASSSSKPAENNQRKFNFGITPQSTNKEPVVATPVVSGWGDKFKPKEGSWECKQCFVRNEGNVETCSACNGPKDPNAPKTQNSSIFGDTSSAPKFNFGIPSNAAADATAAAAPVSSIFDGTGAHKFSFGIPSDKTDRKTIVISFGETKPESSIFSSSQLANSSGLINFSATPKSEDKTAPTKAALLPTPQSENSAFGAKEGGTFDFVFKPKTPTKGKSPVKSPGRAGDESDNEYVSEDEGHHIHFSPIVPLPDKVEVVTGEEDEDELYGHRAKLFRFTAGEWKERGIGIVKILKHKKTQKLRVVMRREQVLKICLNHVLTPELSYTQKDDKTWLFAANDFSEGQYSLDKFCLRFKTKEISLKFKEAIDNARAGLTLPTSASTSELKKDKDSSSDDVIFVSETQATSEEKQKAKELMLPENFFTYKSKEPCQGCRGCKDEDEEAKSLSNKTILSLLKATSSSTPMKNTTPTFASPATSLYGTPTNVSKIDTSLFRTPLGSAGANTNASSSPGNVSTDSNATDKENTFTQKTFGSFDSQSSIFGTPQNQSVVQFDGVDKTPTGVKTSVIAPQKFNPNVFSTSATEKSPEAKTLFGNANKSIFGESKPMFGSDTTSSNTSIFSFKPRENDKTDVKSIFGQSSDKKFLFGSGSNQSSVFGAGSQGAPVFGANSTDTSQVPKSIFGSQAAAAPTWTFGDVEQVKPDVTNSAPVADKKQADSTEVKPAKEMWNLDKTLSFTDVTSSGFEKKANFSWEGAGQQLFSKSGGKPGARDDGAEGEAGADEEYDPHYEPIVPLPDKITVTTGEEDEEKVFGERSKLYRFDGKQWKERGVGEMKILYHPQRDTYRMLLRREQVHKAVLNMLISMDLELLPMKNMETAWTWAGRNYAETQDGEQETLAVRFKNTDLSTSFKDKVIECVRKLQASAAKAIREGKTDTSDSASVQPLRLPKHLQEGARADNDLASKSSAVPVEAPVAAPAAAPGTTSHAAPAPAKPNGDSTKETETKQVHFQEPEEEEDHEEDYGEEYEDYYNEEAYYSCSAKAEVRAGAARRDCDDAFVEVQFDPDCYTPKILLTDAATGEILANMFIHTDTNFQITDNTCSWSGTDFTSDASVNADVTLRFADHDTTMQFYDSVETSKNATYSSTEQDS